MSEDRQPPQKPDTLPELDFLGETQMPKTDTAAVGPESPTMIHRFEANDETPASPANQFDKSNRFPLTRQQRADIRPITEKPSDIRIQKAVSEEENPKN